MTNDEQTFVENLKQSGALSNADLTKASNMRSHTLGQSLSQWLVKLGPLLVVLVILPVEVLRRM